MPDLDTILQQLSDDERVEALAITLRQQPRARLHVGPVITAARPALTAALATRVTGPLVYVVDSSETATRAVNDLQQWLGPDAALLMPASDALAYERMSTSAGVLAGRLRVLQRLADERVSARAGEQVINQDDISSHHPLTASPAQVIVASVRALMQPTLTPAEWQAATVRLRQGDTLDMEQLIARWIELGYRAAPTVEEPGELNRRGGILDIFPPGDDMPLRIEFFGDEVDSLRRFDPLTQRSQLRLNEAIVGPPQELPFWRRDEVFHRIRALDIVALRPEARDEWQADIARLEQGERFEGRGLFAPFFRTNNTLPTLLDHLPPGAALLFSDLTLLTQHAAELQRQAEERHSMLAETGELPADYPLPYVPWDDLLAHAANPALVDLSSNEWLQARDDAADSAVVPLQGFQPLAPPAFTPADLFGGQLKRLVDDVVTRLDAGEQVVMVTPQAARMQELVEERTKNQEPRTTDDALAITQNSKLKTQNFLVIHGSLDQGWHAPAQNLTLYSDTEIFGWRQRRSVSERTRKRDRNTEERAAFLRGLKEGDYVVHIEHGIAQYEGLVRRAVGGIEREYLNLRYAEGDRLYVPVDQIDRVSRYIGAGDATPHLTRLGTQEWERAKRKARAAVQDLAADLLQLYAKRQLGEGHAYQPDTEWQRELEDAFPYDETDDQLRALHDVKRDMETPHPMDRLICGDVGFGKTEVALRAAFKAVQDDKQVAVLVPTTVLAQQHYETFSRRMAAFPVTVEMISRFRSASEQRRIIDRLARGEIDIIIGTHRLLSKDVLFKDLGLLVVDEEQRFGVRHKERIKQLRANVDVLTLTATPIPRTLHMAMAGIRDLSVIDTPPQDRLPIRTYMLPYDERLAREAILREMDRGGQVFFVHNRVQSIYYVANKLQQLVPEANIVVGHGQMHEHQLEKVMLQFFEGEADVLVSTTIIENGLDVQNANTIIVEDATRYGLAQLYQLRGRVGRSTQRAYAYLFYPGDHRMSADAQERLLAIQEATDLGAGLRIAMRDLEIRGAGNLLGAEQSGQIAAVGFDLYTRLLAQAVEQLKASFEQAQMKDGGRTTNGDKETRRQGDEDVLDVDSPAHPLTRSPAPKVTVDERVLVAPLVTLDLPIDAYLPTEYIANEQVRLAVYQRLADVQTPQAVRDLRQELRDRFGEPPEPAADLLTWLMIKALALQAGVSSIITTDEEFIVRLPAQASRAMLQRRYARDAAVKIGPQFARLDRRELGGEWIPVLTGVLDTIGGERSK